MTVCDANGFRLSEELTYDDGRIRSTTFSDGVITGQSWADPLDEYTWTSIVSTFDSVTGLLSGQTLTRDAGDGRVVAATFVDGVIATRTTTDADDNFDWASLAQTFGVTGVLESATKTYDDGRLMASSYYAGVLVDRTITDVADAYDWTSRTYNYDNATGKLLTLTTLFDDRTSATTSPTIGPIGQTVRRADLSDAYDWDTIVTTYDAAGERALQVRTLDNGIEKTTAFTAGVRVSRDWTDEGDVRNWDTRSVTYDAAGRIATSDTLLDDSRRVVQAYENGLKTTRTTTDTSTGGTAFSWAKQEATFDSTGQITSRVTTFDDGRTATDTYTNGVRQGRTLDDSLDARAWDTIEKVYNTDNGALIYTHTTRDNGSETYVDERGLKIVTGGTAATVVEDSAQDLDAAGMITLLTDYRGSTTFTAINSVAGANGHGVFTLGTDGAWTYAATNSQPEIQALDAGETLTDSFTAMTTDGVETTVSVTIEGRTDAAPVFVGETALLLGSAGNTATAGAAFDVLSQFTNATNPFEFFGFSGFSGLPDQTPLAYLSPDFANGLIGLVDHTDRLAVGDHVVTIDVRNTDLSEVTQQIVALTVAMDHNFGANYKSVLDPAGPFIRASNAQDRVTFGTGTNSVIFDTQLGDDIITFGSSAATAGGQIYLASGGGDDIVTFGDGAGGGNGSSVRVDAGEGNDVVTFGNDAGNRAKFGYAPSARDGIIDIDGGDGSDSITFGKLLAFGNFNVAGGLGADSITFGATFFVAGPFDIGGNDASVSGGDGADTLTFGDYFGLGIFNTQILGDEGDDAIHFGDNAGQSSLSFRVDGGVGNDTISFGDNAFKDALVGITIVGGADDDDISLGRNAGEVGTKPPVVVDAGSGNDTITVGEESARLTLLGGTGDDIINVADRSQSAAWEARGGIGADTITIGDTTNGAIYLGADTDTDRLIFTGSVGSVEIYDWTAQDDPITFEDVGTDIWFKRPDIAAEHIYLENDAGDLIRIYNAGGNDLDTVVSGLTLFENSAPVARDPNPGFDAVGVGNLSSAFSQDLRALFTDVDLGTINNEAIAVTANLLPTGWDLTDSILQRTTAETSFATLGTHEVTLTATDYSLATASITLDLIITLQNDFGFQYGFSVDAGTVTGSAGNDKAVFGAQSATTDRGFLEVETFAGEDTIAFSDFVAGNGGTLVIDSGADGDTITFGRNAASGNADFAGGHGKLDVNSGAGGDTITFGDYAGEFNPLQMHINAGEGDDIVTFGVEAGQEADNFRVDAGLGADTLTFGADVGRVTIDLGADSDIDRLTLLGTFFEDTTNVTIENWVQGVDVVDVDDTVAWTLHDDGTDTTLSFGVNDITFSGVTGLTSVEDFLI